MSRVDVIRAWKDSEYRGSLSESELALLPENPAGMVELSDADLLMAGGKDDLEPNSTVSCVTAISGVTIALTQIYSCAGAGCKGTAENGTCAFLTVGCCG